MARRASKDRDPVISPWAKTAYTAEDFPGEREGLRYAHLVRRTLRGDYDYVFQPDSVFYAGQMPAAYIKTVEHFSEPDIRKWQKFLWNQAVVPVLIVKTRTQLRVYSQATTPSDSEDIEVILETAADALESIKADLETGDFYQEHHDKLTRGHRVDRYLLRSLNATATKIAESRGGVNEANLDFAHKFLTRILFVCYLIERGMIKGRHFGEGHILRPLEPRNGPKPFLLRDLLESKDTVKDRREALLAVFEHVKDHFNGSMFPRSITAEAREYKEVLFDLILSFLQGQDMESGQLSLGFWAYDFSVIPIEMISCVYDGFLKSQGQTAQASGDEDTQRGAGAYYTPPHLAEMVTDIALEGSDKPVHEMTVLDPACGSGVFLVTILGRMADSLRAKYKQTTGLAWGQRILDLLPRLFGVDTNSTACHIACFSLYLAALEQMSPSDVETLDSAGKRFPYLLFDPKHGIVDGKNIVCGNFFDPQLAMDKTGFDVVIGNPPWVSRKHKEDQHFLNWCARGGKSDETRRAPQKQIAYGFMWTVGQRLDLSGHACLLLPAGALLNLETNKFQASWLRHVTVDRVVNFSDLCFVLFDGSSNPCSAIRFLPKPCKDMDHSLRYESPKCDVRTQQGGPVFIHEEDTAFLRMRDILAAADGKRAGEFWKSRLWGSSRGLRFLTRLWDYPTLGDLCYSTQIGVDKKRWLKGQGIGKGNESERGWWTANDLYIDAGDLHPLVLLPSQCVALKDMEKAKLGDSAQWPRDKDLFLGPKVLIRGGASTPRATFCTHRVLFRDALTSIAGPDSDAHHLRFLAAVLGSDLAKYYLFHTSSRWGIERHVVRTEERMRLPFFLPEAAPSPKEASDIADAVAAKMKSFEQEMRRTNGALQEAKAEQLQEEVEGLIRDYYEVDAFEGFLIEDTVRTIIPSSTPNRATVDIPTLRYVSEDQQIAYADTLCDAMAAYCGKDTVGRPNKGPYAATVFRGSPYSVIRIDRADRPRKTILEGSSDRLPAILARLQPILEEEYRRFVFCHDLKVFSKDALYILKPRQYRFWMRTAALEDADEVAGSRLIGGER